MDEILLVKHLIEIIEIAHKNGILQLEDYNVKTNKWLSHPIYSYCLKTILSGANIPEEVKLLRSRKELIIIKGFELINNIKTNDYSIINIANILGSMLKKPLLIYEYLDFPTNSEKSS